MKMILPINISDDQIIASSLAEDDHPAWSQYADYVVGDRVIRQHAIYEAAADHAGVDPVNDPTARWIRIGATNKFRAFDGYLTEPTQATQSLSYTFRLGQSNNAIALLNMTAGALNIAAVSDSEGHVFTRDIQLISTENVFDLYSYFHAPIELISDFVIDDLPLFGDIEVTVTLSGGEISVGQIVLGNAEVLGAAKFGTSVSFKDYSTKDRDTFGNAIVLERAFADVVDFDFVVPTERVRQLRRKIAARRAKATVFYTTPETLNYGTLVYGFPGQLLVTLSGPAESDVTLDVEGLT